MRVYRSTDKYPLVAAAIYMACRIEVFPMWVDYLSVVSNIPSEEIIRVFQSLQSAFGINPPIMSPEHFVIRFVSQLKLNPKYVHEAQNICKYISKNELISGRPPQVIAVTVIILVMLSAGESVSVSSACAAALVKITSINRIYSELKGTFRSLLSKEFLVDHPIIPELPDTLQERITLTTSESITRRQQGIKRKLRPLINTCQQISQQKHQKV